MKVNDFFEKFGEKGPAKQCEVALKEFYLDDFNIWDELYYSAKNKLFKDLTLKIMYFKAKNFLNWSSLFVYTAKGYAGQNAEIHAIAFDKMKERSNIEDWLSLFLCGESSESEAIDWLLNLSYEEFKKMLPKKYTAKEWIEQSLKIINYRGGSEKLNLLMSKMSEYSIGTEEVWLDHYDRTKDEFMKSLILKKIEG